MSLFRKTTTPVETSQTEILCNSARNSYEAVYIPNHPVLAWKHTSTPAKNDHLDNYVEIDPFHTARQTARVQHGFIAAEPKKKASRKPDVQDDILHPRPQKKASRKPDVQDEGYHPGPQKKASPKRDAVQPRYRASKLTEEEKLARDSARTGQPQKKASPKRDAVQPRYRASKLTEEEKLARDSARTGQPKKKASRKKTFGTVFKDAKTIEVFLDKRNETNVEVMTHSNNTYGFFGESLTKDQEVASEGESEPGKRIDFEDKTVDEVIEIIKRMFN